MRTSVLSRVGPAWLAAVFLMLLSSAPMFADMFTITTDADTYISSSNPTTNFGNVTSLVVDPGDITLLGFDLSSLPAGLTAGQVSQAMLSFWVTQNTSVGDGLLNIASLTATWTETGATFNNRPTAGSLIIAGVPVFGSGFLITLDVTSLVQGWITNPITNDGVQIFSTGPTFVDLASRENSIDEPAKLDITTTTTTTPEPGSMPMLLMVLAALGWAVRKQRRVV